MLIKMCITINKTGEWSAVGISLFLYFEDTNQLLVELTCPIMHAPKRWDICMIDLVAASNSFITGVLEVVTHDPGLIRRPTAEAMDQHYRIVILPQLSWQ